jgi:hypothetical protein
MKTVLPTWLGRTPSARARALTISISGVLPFSALNCARHLFSEGSLYRPARRCEAPKQARRYVKGRFGMVRQECIRLAEEVPASRDCGGGTTCRHQNFCRRLASITSTSSWVRATQEGSTGFPVVLVKDNCNEGIDAIAALRSK